MAEVFKIPVFSEICTRIAELKLQIAIHYNIKPIKKQQRWDLNPREQRPMDYQSIALTSRQFLSIKGVTKLYFCMYTLIDKFPFLSGTSVSYTHLTLPTIYSV